MRTREGKVRRSGKESAGEASNLMRCPAFKKLRHNHIRLRWVGYPQYRKSLPTPQAEALSDRLRSFTIFA